MDECRSYGMEIMVSVWPFTCPGSRSYDMLVKNNWVYDIAPPHYVFLPESWLCPYPIATLLFHPNVTSAARPGPTSTSPTVSSLYSAAVLSACEG